MTQTYLKNSLTPRQTSWCVIACLFLYLLCLASLRPLSLPDEGRYADVGRWMLMSGDWLAPRLNGIPFFHKPPLLHWLQASAFGLLGVGAWTSRLIPAVHAGLMLVVMYSAARAYASEKFARDAVLILGSSIGFLIAGQYVNHDMLVAAWISIAVWCFALSFKNSDRVDVALSLLGFAACGMGLLSKGLIGFVLPGLVIFCWLLWTGQLARLKQMPWLRGLLLWAVISLPWFVLGQMKYPDLFNYLIIGQHFSRYVGNDFNNQWGGWFYVAVLLVMLFPWSFLILQDLRPLKWLSIWRTQRKVPAQHFESLLWIWTLSIGIFFTLPKSKIVGYILPVLPPLACLGALAWQKCVAQGRSVHIFTALLASSLCLSGVLNWQAGKYSLKHTSQDVAQFLRCAVSPDDTVFVSGGYPYDLPFYAQLQKPVWVAIDWDEARRDQIDNWSRELYEGANFELSAAKVLVPLSVLEHPSRGSWLVVPNDTDLMLLSSQWSVFAKGQAWQLLRAKPSAPESPPTAQDERLNRCQSQGKP
jgi:4-amino-4-deoxy-L-arabinose transferase-like glycosyltransferase